MNRAYQIHLEQIEAHDASHPSTLAVEVQQIVNPDLSCIVCYPPVHYFRAFRTFWNRYQPAYLATSYTQQTIANFHTLREPNTYNTVRAAARDIVFSCRYNNPHLNPIEVIAALL